MAEERKLNWDDIAVTPENEYTVLEEGTYVFQVEDVKKKYYQPKAGSKLPACNMAEVKIRVENPNGKDVTVFENMYLLESQLWKIEQFFVSAGLMKAGEAVRLSLFQKAIGETGWVRVYQHTYNGKTYNRIKEWVAPADAPKGKNLVNKTVEVNPDDLPF